MSTQELVSGEAARIKRDMLLHTLRTMKDNGLCFADCVRVFGVERETDPYARWAQAHLADDDLEFDDHVVLSEGDEGSWVSAWCWVSRESALPEPADNDEENDE